ncbi:hypothetical protein [Haloarcula sp. H-GB5]
MRQILILVLVGLLAIAGCVDMLNVDQQTSDATTSTEVLATSSPDSDPMGYLHITVPETVPESVAVINHDRVESQIISEGVHNIGNSTEYRQNLTEQQYNRTRQTLSKYTYHSPNEPDFSAGWFIEYENETYNVNVVVYGELV